MSENYWIYAIECVQTDEIYIGQSSRAYIWSRWSEHISQLVNGNHTCKLFQKTWNSFPNLKYWIFKVLDTVSVSGKWEANYKEAEWILKFPPDKRLNANNTSVTTLEKRRKILSMLQEGRRYVDIRDEVGISMGMIHKIKKENLFSRSAIAETT